MRSGLGRAFESAAASWACAALTLWVGAALANPAPSSLQIRIDMPQPGEVVKNSVHLAPLRGQVQSGSEAPANFDLLVAIDVSHSTRYPSGIDVDGDGELGVNPHLELSRVGTRSEDVVCTDPDDTILAAEIAAARELLEVLQPGRTRVAIVTFSGEVDEETGLRRDRLQHDAWVSAPLTADFSALPSVLSDILARGPFGATNFAAAVRLAVVELAGLPGAVSSARRDATKVVLLLSDGVPTFPFGRGSVADPEDTEAAINAARLARKAGVSIHTFALGPQALSQPVAATEIARITVASYTPVRKPGDIVSFLQGVSFANIEDVVITNLTTREVSYDVSLAPDGTFSGFVPVREGSNRVRVTALAANGEEQSFEVDLEFEKSGLSARELERELARIQARNRELMLLVERKRIQSFRERQKKSVVVEVDDAAE